MSISKEKKNSLIGSTSVVSGATAFSRVLGLVREQVMAYFFGAGMATDAFLTAFRIPNLLRDMFAEGALSSAFVPVFKEKMVTESDEEAFSLAHLVITAVLLIVGMIVLLGIIAAPVIIYISAYGFTLTPEKFDLTVSLTRVMFVYLLLVSLSAVVMGMLNSFGRFGIPALSPALFNLGIIGTVVLFAHQMEQPVYALAIGVLVGGLGQLVIQLPLLFKIGYRFKFTLNLLDEGFKKVVKLLMPMIIGLSAGRINILLNTLIASFLIEGSISYLSYAYRLMHFPLGVFAVALGTVALPRVSGMIAKKQFDRLDQAFEQTFNLNLFVVVPSAVFLAMMGHELISLIFMWGKFNEPEVANTALALTHYAYGLIGFSAVRVVVPFFYGFGDSRIPMRASVLAVVVNILLYYPLVKVLSFAGLAAATSISALVNLVVLLRFLPQKGVKFNLSHLGVNFVKMAVAAMVAFYCGRLLPFRIFASDQVLWYRMERVLLPLLVAVVIYIVLAYLLRIEAMKMLIARLTKKKDV